MDMRAVVFSNFPQDQYEEKFASKFGAHDIEVVRVLKPDHAISVEDLAKADVLISLREMMSLGQQSKLRDFAKKNGKPIVGITRQVSTWPDAFEPFRKLKMVPPPPPSSEPVRIVNRRPARARLPQLDFVEPVVEAPEPIEAAPPSQPEPEKTIEEQLEEAKTLNALYEEENDALTHKLDDAAKEAKKLADDLSQVRKLNEDLHRETRGLNAEKYKLEGKVSDLEASVAVLRAKPTPRSIDDLFKALESMRQLVKMGLMSPDECFEKLMNYKPTTKG